MILFLSTFINKLDKKGRVSVPASFRSMLAGQSSPGAVGFRSYKLLALEVMGIDRMHRLSESLDQLDVFSEAQDDLTAAIFADAQLLPFDGEGRIILPSLFLEHTQIKDTVAFVGRGATFQIWNPAHFEIHQKDARKQAQEKQASLKIRESHA